MAENKSKSKKSASKKASSAQKKASEPLSSSKQLSTAKKRVLGRGLKALLSDTEPELRARSPLQGIEEISLEAIEANPYQPRSRFDAQALEELAQSIATHGIIQPITVRALEKHRYQLISGERRLQACRKLGRHTMPAFVRKAEAEQMLEMALIENIQREALNTIEIALAYQRLISECNLKQEDLAQRVGKDRSTVTNYLRLLKLPPAIQAALRDDLISMGHARSLLAIKNAAAQLLLLQEVLKKKLSVREIEDAVRRLSQKKIKKTPMSTPENYRALQEQLSSQLSTRVRLRSNQKKGGEIRISFFSEDDLSRILHLITS